MRGKRREKAPRDTVPGITPADAGKTHFRRSSESAAEDHPRGCGENGVFLSSGVCVTGSPPRMRGKLGTAVGAAAAGGITPADAGKTSYGAACSACTGDHPRGCGENIYTCIGNAMSTGSPPRMRGKRRYGNRETRDCGITPADAGKTACVLSLGYWRGDHPRGCGENKPPCCGLDDEPGSPPRMRGKHGKASPDQMWWRITPADAGKTPVVQLPAQLRQDHPRGCGENPCSTVDILGRIGSPPRMRGKPQDGVLF